MTFVKKSRLLYKMEPGILPRRQAGRNSKSPPLGDLGGLEHEIIIFPRIVFYNNSDIRH